MDDRIVVIIPAYNEERAIARVIADVPKDLASEVIVVNNRSSDLTEDVARAAGATVLSQPQRGYGSACLKGIEYLATRPPHLQPDIVVFMDADYADHPEEMSRVVQPIIEGQYDLVIGSRTLGVKERGAMQPQQVFGNWLATRLIRLLYRKRFTDLGPFRAIRFGKLLQLGMRDRDYGWTVEMQVKAAKHRFRCTEVPVSYRRRIGKSKVTGTVKGSVAAGYKILFTIFRYL